MLKRLSQVLFVAIITVLICLGSGYFYLKRKLYQQHYIKQEKIIDIPMGSNVNDIASILYRQNLLPKANHFNFFTQVLGVDNNLKSGEFLIPKKYSIYKIIKIITTGKAIMYRITFPEGLTNNQIFQKIKAAKKLVGEVAINVPEGYLMPDTYYFTKGESRNTVVQRMYKRMLINLDKIWQARDPNLILKNKNDLLILASNVEKETGISSERSHIAGVYLNRIKKRMHLNSDPAVRYGLYIKFGKPLNEALTKTELKIDTPFNTYRRIGLPPGAICNPGVKSLMAVAQPLATKDLYFVANGTGGHEFAPTMKIHNQNRQKWKKIRHQLKQKQKMEEDSKQYTP